MSTIPTFTPTGTITTSTSLSTIIGSVLQSILNFVYFFIAFAAVLYIVWAGYKYMTAGGDTKQVGEARTAILNAVIGLAIVMSAYAITSFAFSLGNAAGGAIGGTTQSPRGGGL